MPTWSYTVTEYDPAKPWVAVGQQHRTIELADEASFFDWAHRTWPKPRYGVELDPGQRARWPSSVA